LIERSVKMIKTEPEIKRAQAGRDAVANLILQGKPPTIRAREKEAQALNWLYRWGWSTTKIIDGLSGVIGRGYANKLVKKGLMIKSKTTHANITSILTLTEMGVERAMKTIINPYDYEFHPNKYRTEHFRHYLISQQITQAALLNGLISSFEPESDYIKASAKYEKRPDIIFKYAKSKDFFSEKRAAVEVELNGKYGRKLDLFIYSCLKLLGTGEVDFIYILTTLPSIEKNYTNAFKVGKKVGIWRKNSSDNYKIVDYYEIEEEDVKDKIIIDLIDENDYA